MSKTSQKRKSHFSSIVLAVVCLPLLSSAEGWNEWKHRLPVFVQNQGKTGSDTFPTDFFFTLKKEECEKPETEIRLVHQSPDGRMAEVPFQLSLLRTWTRDSDSPKGVPTVNGRMTFFPIPHAAAKGRYFILHGNPKADPPSYPTDLRVSGTGPAWTIENSKMKVDLRGADAVKAADIHDYFGNCGQIASVTLKSKPNSPFTNKNRCLHWNPGILIPNRGWLNAHAWDPPERFEIEAGPLFVEIRRRGPFPLLPEVELAVVYRIFSGRDYIWCSAKVQAKEDIGIVSLRTNEIVFDEGFFTRIAWENRGRLHDRLLAPLVRANRHGDILRLPADAALLVAYNPETKVGMASIRIENSAIGPFGEPAARFHAAAHVVKGNDPIGSGGLFFWFRTYVDFGVDWDRTQRFVIPAGTAYSDQDLYYFYDIDKAGRTAGALRMLEGVRNHRLQDIQVGPFPFARDMQ